jgi:hypothetical protein
VTLSPKVGLYSYPSGRPCYFKKLQVADGQARAFALIAATANMQ